MRENAHPADADAALTTYERLVREFPQPQYQWRVPMLRATFASLAGDFATAERLSDEAFAIADEGEIRAGKIAWALFRLSLAHLRGDPASVAPYAERIDALAGPMSGSTGFIAWLYAATGRHDEARALLEGLIKVPHTFPWCLISGETVCILGDRAMAERFYPWLLRHAKDNSLFWGPLGSVVFGPTQRVAGDVARLLGKTEEARQLYAEAIALGERMNAPAFVTLAQRGLDALDAARATHSEGPSVRPSRVRPHACPFNRAHRGRT